MKENTLSYTTRIIIELTYCIKYIKGKEYNDTTTEISRDAYKILMEKKENE